jgi:hypothetical protein
MSFADPSLEKGLFAGLILEKVFSPLRDSFFAGLFSEKVFLPASSQRRSFRLLPFVLLPFFTPLEN